MTTELRILKGQIGYLIDIRPNDRMGLGEFYSVSTIEEVQTLLPMLFNDLGAEDPYS